MSFVSAGAYAREIDLSLYAETLTETIVGMVHTFNKGPIGERTLVSNVGRLQELFGDPIDPTVSASACQGWFAAREYLKKGNQLYITRVESAANPATTAAMSLQGSSDDTIATGVDGVTSVPATKTLTSALGDFINDGVLVGDILEIHDGTADDGFYVIANVAATVLTVSRNWPVGSLSTLDFTVWSAKKESKDDGVTSAASTRQFTSATALFSSLGVTAGDILVVDDTGDTEDNGVYLISSVDSETQLTVDRDWHTGGLTALTFTVYGDNSAGADGSTATDGEFVSAGSKFQDHGVKAGDILYIYDAVDSGDNGYYLITGLKSGAEDTTLEVNEAAWPTGSLSSLDFEVLPGSVQFDGLSEGTAFKDLIIKGNVNASDRQNFDFEVKSADGTLQLEKVFNLDRSNVVSEMTSNSGYFSATVITGRGEPCPGKEMTVSGGDDGYTGIVDGDYIGNRSLGTGLYSFWNPEQVDVNIVMCPGVSSQNVQDFLIQLCETRGDCMTILDPPDWATVDSVQDILDFTNGNLTRTTALNSSYAAIYWTWQQVYDEFHDADVWTAPSGHIAGVYTYNDNVAAPWIAPAGLKRGKVSGSRDVRYSPDQDDRDALYGPGAVVNPIVNFTGEGITVFGQKTTQRATTALNRVNVRRTLLYLKKIIATSSRYLVFDPNDDVLFREFKQLVEPVFDNVVARRGLVEYLITNATTDTDRSNNKAVFKMFVKPQTTAEIIELQFVLTPQGADFQELLAA